MQVFVIGSCDDEKLAPAKLKKLCRLAHFHMRFLSDRLSGCALHGLGADCLEIAAF